MIISEMKENPGRNRIPGNCANCNIRVYESSFVLDDCYNVWMGKCPKCNALNFLSLNYGLRGYDSSKMCLVLPTEEEIETNNLPKGTPSSGKCGKPANIHGSNLGELCHKLFSSE